MPKAENILSLAAGEPDFDTPEHVKEAAIVAMREGKTKYTAVAGTRNVEGMPSSDKFRRDNGLEYTARVKSWSHTGAKQVLYNLCQALLNDGDEVHHSLPPTGCPTRTSCCWQAVKSCDHHRP